MKTKMFTRIFVLLVVTVILMTTFAYATDLLEVANKGKAYASQLISAVSLIGVLYAVGLLAMKRSFTTAVITAVLGAALVYFIANPDKLTGIINATLGNLV